MENKEITKTFPVAETFLASWRYCRENRRHIAVFTLVNWLLLLLGFKFMVRSLLSVQLLFFPFLLQPQALFADAQNF